ncbi:MAG: RIP metalloprotease RseP [Puniceicoccales bacterium]|jgi:RIP metalloprotease RseP|nr:RIP metalloprotease RseP [Puniceicoccales bacterium]
MEIVSDCLLPVVWVVVFFGGSIMIHELGHFIAAKKTGMLVPKFSIGFGPKLFGFRYKETEFVISLLPIGGYVAVPQLANLKEIEGEFELPKNVKPATNFAKIITAFAGPFANLLFAIFLATIVYFIGTPTSEGVLSTEVGYVPRTLTLRNFDEIPSPAHEAGILPGDRILSIDGNVVKRFDDVATFIALGDRKDASGRPLTTVTIERNGEKLDFELNPVTIPIYGDGSDEIRTIGAIPRQTLRISEFLEQSSAEECGLMEGDLIVSANGTELLSAYALYDALSVSNPVTLEIERDGTRKNFQIPTMTKLVLKPFLLLKFGGNSSAAAVIPAGGVGLSVDCHDQFSGIQFFCNDEEFLKKNGISNGDEITGVDGEVVSFLKRLAEIASHNSKISLNMSTKNGEKITDVSEISSAKFHDARFGNFLGILFENDVVIDNPTPLSQVMNSATLIFKTLGSLFSKNSDISPKYLMGPAGLIKTLYSSAKGNFSRLLWFVILINVNLAILNLLPLPVLDGGLIAIVVLEKITGLGCMGKFFSKIQTIFFVLLFGLMAYVTFFDFKRILAEKHQPFDELVFEQLSVRYDDDYDDD